MTDFICIHCRKEKAKELTGEPRPYFCTNNCAAKYALEIANKLADCPNCKSTLTHRRGGGYYYDNDRRCAECGHTWETK